MHHKALAHLQQSLVRQSQNAALAGRSESVDTQQCAANRAVSCGTVGSESLDAWQ